MSRPRDIKVLLAVIQHGRADSRAFASGQVSPSLDESLTVTDAELSALEREFADGWDALVLQLNADFAAMARDFEPGGAQ